MNVLVSVWRTDRSLFETLDYFARNFDSSNMRVHSVSVILRILRRDFEFSPAVRLPSPQKHMDL